MRRSVGMAIGAAVLSVTIGVLVGVVIHAGMVQRADAPLPPALSAGSSGSSPLAEPDAQEPSVPTLDGEPSESSFRTEPGTSTTSPTMLTTSPADAETTTDSALSHGFGPVTTPTTEPAAPTTGAPLPPATSAPTSSSSTGARTSASTPASTSVLKRSTVTVTSTVTSGSMTRAGVAAASRPCTTLGARSSNAQGTTLYCQRDQTDRTLRWRAVTAGGGCLNQSMMGVGADRATYACQLGADGRNHWVPAG